MVLTILGMQLYVDFVQVGILALAFLFAMAISYVIGDVRGYDAGSRDAQNEWHSYWHSYLRAKDQSEYKDWS